MAEGSDSGQTGTVLLLLKLMSAADEIRVKGAKAATG
jgi:hypothetical protein